MYNPIDPMLAPNETVLASAVLGFGLPSHIDLILSPSSPHRIAIAIGLRGNLTDPTLSHAFVFEAIGPTNLMAMNQRFSSRVYPILIPPQVFDIEIEYTQFSVLCFGVVMNVNYTSALVGHCSTPSQVIQKDFSTFPGSTMYSLDIVTSLTSNWTCVSYSTNTTVTLSCADLDPAKPAPAWIGVTTAPVSSAPPYSHLETILTKADNISCTMIFKPLSGSISFQRCIQLNNVSSGFSPLNFANLPKIYSQFSLFSSPTSDQVHLTIASFQT